MKRALLALSLALAAAPLSAAPSRAVELPLVKAPELLEPALRPRSVPSTAAVDGVRVVASSPPQHARRAPSMAGTSVEISADSREGSCVSIGASGRDFFRSTSVFVDRAEGVVPVRVETLREGPSGAALVVTDLWVDTSSLGVLSAKRAEVPLTRVATGPLAAAAYAYRDAESVQLIVPTENNGQIQRGDGMFVSASCAMLRAELKAERGKSASLTGFIMKQTAAVEASEGRPAVPSMTVRLGLAASLSQTSRDPAPVLSVVLRALDELPTVQQRPRGG